MGTSEAAGVSGYQTLRTSFMSGSLGLFNGTEKPLANFGE